MNILEENLKNQEDRIKEMDLYEWANTEWPKGTTINIVFPKYSEDELLTNEDSK